MVSLKQIKSANAQISQTLPPNLVAVFSGATSGIGRASLLGFAKHAASPRIYFVGRSEEAAAEITAQLKELNKDGTYIFIKKDVSLMVNVDELCREIAEKEKYINLLFMSQGSVQRGDTDEGLGRVMATMVYSRLRMLNNLGPLLERAPTFRRVVSMLAGTKEGHVFLDDIPARNVGFLSTRSHMTAIMTLWLELSASKWPSVSFIHNFPGAVESNLLRRESVGPVIATVAWLFSSAFRLFGMSHDECGERHAYLCSSAKFPAGAPVEGDTNGVALDGLGVATGTDGKTGSGTYSITEYAEGTPAATLTVLDGLRKQGSIDKIREYVEGDFIRITGSAALNL